MIVSTKGRYALRVMVELAQHQGEGYVPLNVIAERQEISEKYLESILKVLVQDELLSGLRGRGGGYRLLHRRRRTWLPQKRDLPFPSGMAETGQSDQWIFRRYHTGGSDTACQ